MVSNADLFSSTTEGHSSTPHTAMYRNRDQADAVLSLPLLQMLWTNVCVYVCMLVCVCMCVCVFVWVCPCVCVYVPCICACLCVGVCSVWAVLSPSQFVYFLNVRLFFDDIRMLTVCVV
eukprot:GHVQ01001698.1.p2 GENE.GHVQ01001698.1~~GHVQ01001698.1.p2  ORF type:complete len:119 (-),score=19.42 GHVQ01001698.1:135-491(-)